MGGARGGRVPRPLDLELSGQPDGESAEADDAGGDDRALESGKAAPRAEGAEQVAGVGGGAEQEPAADLDAVAALERLEEAVAENGVASAEPARQRACPAGRGIG